MFLPKDGSGSKTYSSLNERKYKKIFKKRTLFLLPPLETCDHPQTRIALYSEGVNTLLLQHVRCVEIYNFH